MKKFQKKHVPNSLTILRGVLTIVIIVLFNLDFPNKFLWIFGVFAIASFTDYLDGKIARKYQLESKFGKVFDSLFDKIFILSIYMLLLPFEIVPTWVFVMLLVRDIFVDGLKNYSLSNGQPISPKLTGKIKFNCQILMVGTMLLYLDNSNNEILYDIMIVFTALSLLFSYLSGIFYTKDFYKLLKN